MPKPEKPELTGGGPVDDRKRELLGTAGREKQIEAWQQAFDSEVEVA